MHEPQTHSPAVPDSAHDDEWLSLPDAAERLGLDAAGLKKMLRDGEILASDRDGQQQIPSALIHNGATSRYLRGVINLLRDGGYSDDEALSWLLRDDESLGACPAVAMHHNLHREVSRRAQALAF